MTARNVVAVVGSQSDLKGRVYPSQTDLIEFRHAEMSRQRGGCDPLLHTVVRFTILPGWDAVTGIKTPDIGAMQRRRLQELIKVYIAHVERHTHYTIKGLSLTCRLMDLIKL